MKKARQEKPALKTELLVLKTGVKAGKMSDWWGNAKSWVKKNMKPII